jgi:hypothetical protein
MHNVIWQPWPSTQEVKQIEFKARLLRKLGSRFGVMDGVAATDSGEIVCQAELFT